MASRKRHSACSSRLPQLFNDYQQKLQRIDALERKLESLVSEKRQRALNILDETPTHRKSHLRLFVTHRCQQQQQEEESLLSPEPSPPSLSSAMMTATTAVNTVVGSETQRKKRNKWTLVIEGRLLVGHLDHERANIIEKEAADAELINGGHLHSDGKGEGADVYTNHAHRSSDRQANRAIYDREGEEPITPIKFTHFSTEYRFRFSRFKELKMRKPIQILPHQRRRVLNRPMPRTVRWVEANDYRGGIYRELVQSRLVH